MSEKDCIGTAGSSSSSINIIVYIFMSIAHTAIQQKAKVGERKKRRVHTMAMKKLGAVVVIGVSSSPGLGLSIAKRFAIEGKRVAIIGRQEEKLKNCKAEIEAHCGNKCIATYRAVDCTDREALRGALDSINEELCSDSDCSLQGVIFNASPRPFPLQSVAETDYDRYIRGVEVTQSGFINSIQWAVPKMLTKDEASCNGNGNGNGVPHPKYAVATEKKGVILVTGATASLRGSADFGSFCAAKAGLRSMAQSLAKETMAAGLHVGTYFLFIYLFIPCANHHPRWLLAQY